MTRHRALSAAAGILTALTLAGCGPRPAPEPGEPPPRWYGIEIADGTIRDLPAPEPAPLQDAPQDPVEFPDPPFDEELFPPDTTIEIGDPPPQPAECLVTGNRIVYGPPADPVFLFPPQMTAPLPGPPPTAATGASVGPVPGTNPPALRIGDNFEYHSDLNGVHGCTSRQFLKRLDAMVHVASGRVGHTGGDGFAAAVPWRPDTDASYRGDTRTGIRQAFGGPIYEGAQDVIHWIDAPGKEHVPDPQLAGFVAIYALLLDGRTWNGDGVTGRSCLVGQTIVMDLATGMPVNPQVARQLLNRLVPNPNADPADAPALANAARILGVAPAQGGFGGQANPEFRQLGCYEF